MLTDFFLYLAQSTVVLSICALVYRLFFCRLTHFQWNRFYLLGSLLISFLLPLLPSPRFFGHHATPDVVSRLNTVLLRQSGDAFLLTEKATPAVFPWQVMSDVLLAFYLAGCLYKTGQLYQNLKAIFKLIRTSQKVGNGTYYSVYSQSDMPPFSFLKYIFLYSGNSSLTAEEQDQVLQHEQIHVKQRHTLDLLLFELAGIVFWFNPIVNYLKFSIRQVHEYIVDQQIIRTGGRVKSYGYLLLKLTTQHAVIPLLTTFSTKPVFQRIQMLIQTPSSPMQKLKFLIILPFLALALILCSFLQPVESRSSTQSGLGKPTKGMPIGSISWQGNTVHSAEELNKALGVREGDRYEKEEFKKHLFNRPGTDVTSLYMDEGYLFFNVDVKENRVGEVVNLELTVFEGPQSTVGKIIVKGNKTVADEKILSLIGIQPGELFNRSKLIKSQQKLAESGYFNPKEIGINPIPDHQMKTVDLEYLLVEK